MLKRLCAAYLAASILVAAPAAAQQPAQVPTSNAACLAPDMRIPERMSWFNGFSPADDLLSAWCRIQTLPGKNLRFNVLFKATGMHRSWDTSFEGGALPASRIVDLIQSLVPASDGPAADENGMEFHKVLRNVVQLGAEKTPGGRVLGFPPSHPASRELFLAEPIALRVRPVVLAGQEFALTVNLSPNLGMLALGLQGQATDVILKGWKDRMDIGNRFTGECSAKIPYCDKLGDVVPFHAPWMVQSVVLETSGENLTAAAMAIMNQVGTSQAMFMKKGNGALDGFKPKNGDGKLSISDGHSTVTVTAVGGAGGTKTIRIEWAAETGNGTLAKNLVSVYENFRNGAAKKETGPAAPDSLGRL